MTDDSELATILVVDDEEAYLDAYATWLRDDYVVRTATSGHEALLKFDADVDVVFLDRLMPGMSGDELLAEIRDSGVDCRVAMLTAVEPELDIIDMGFDEYVIKPVAREELRNVVDNLLTRATLDAQVQECFALASKKTALEANMNQGVLDASPEYRELCRRLAISEECASEALADLIAAGDSAAAYYDIET